MSDTSIPHFQLNRKCLRLKEQQEVLQQARLTITMLLPPPYFELSRSLWQNLTQLSHEHSATAQKKLSAVNFTSLKRAKTNQETPVSWDEVSVLSSHFQTTTPALRILKAKRGLQQTVPIHTFLKRQFLKLSSAARA